MYITKKEYIHIVNLLFFILEDIIMTSDAQKKRIKHTIKNQYS